MLPILLMIGAGIALATVFLAGIGVAKQIAENKPAAPTRESVAAALLFNVLLAGGDRPDEALRDIRTIAGLGAPVASQVDIASWGERFVQIATPQQRAWLLETLVRILAGRGKAVPLRQYSALLDLSFALGFQTDALAKLREQYPFEYVDHAKNARPREADRAGGAAPLFERDRGDAREWLSVLGIEGTVSRQLIITTYRRLAAQHHPDRVFGEGETAQAQSAARFIEITRAYEALLAIYQE